MSETARLVETIARLREQLAAQEHTHDRFVEKVVLAQETERRRLAWDIHDGIAQRLVSLSYHLDAAHQTILDDPGYAAEQVVLARGLADLTMEEARLAIGGLRPPVLDDLGLAGGLASLVKSVPGLQIAAELSDERLTEPIEIALYRIAQEALQNVVKHAAATSALVIFSVRGSMARLEVRDDGAGFNPREQQRTSESGYGLTSMAQRAELVGGTLSIRSRAGSGTSIIVNVPVPP